MSVNIDFHSFSRRCLCAMSIKTKQFGKYNIKAARKTEAAGV